MHSNNYSIKYTELTKICTFRPEQILPSLGSLYRYRNTKWNNVVPSFTIATLYHLDTTDLRHPTNTVSQLFTQHAVCHVLFLGNGVLFFLQTL